MQCRPSRAVSQSQRTSAGLLAIVFSFCGSCGGGARTCSAWRGNTLSREESYGGAPQQGVAGKAEGSLTTLQAKAKSPAPCRPSKARETRTFNHKFIGLWNPVLPDIQTLISRPSKAIETRIFNRKCIGLWNLVLSGHSNTAIWALHGHKNPYFETQMLSVSNVQRMKKYMGHTACCSQYTSKQGLLRARACTMQHNSIEFLRDQHLPVLGEPISWASHAASDIVAEEPCTALDCAPAQHTCVSKLPTFTTCNQADPC